MGATLYRRHPQLAGRVVDKLAFVVTGRNNKLHTLNSTATRIWELCTTPQSCPDVATVLSTEFAVDYDQALSDARACMEDLVSREILIVAHAD